MGMEKKGRGTEEGRDKQRETKNYIAVCKNQFKTCEAEKWVCELDRDEERVSSSERRYPFC